MEKPMIQKIIAGGTGIDVKWIVIWFVMIAGDPDIIDGIVLVCKAFAGWLGKL